MANCCNCRASLSACCLPNTGCFGKLFIGIARSPRALRHIALPTQQQCGLTTRSVSQIQVAHKPSVPGRCSRSSDLCYQISIDFSWLTHHHTTRDRNASDQHPVPRQQLDLGRTNVTQRKSSSPMDPVSRSLPLAATNLFCSKVFEGVVHGRPCLWLQSFSYHHGRAQLIRCFSCSVAIVRENCSRSGCGVVRIRCLYCQWR